MSAIVSDTFRLELVKRRAAGARVYQIARAADVRANELSGIAAGSIGGAYTFEGNARMGIALAGAIGLQLIWRARLDSNQRPPP